jgi:predicted transcriptional regulator
VSTDGDVTILWDVRLDQIVARLDRGETVEPVTLRELLTWFGADRRGVLVNRMIRDALDSRNLRVEPDLVATSLEGEIEFYKGSRAAGYYFDLLRHALASTWLAAWIDENPDVSESGIRSKAADLDKLNIGELMDYEDFFDDFMKIGPLDENLDGYKKLKEIAITLKSGGTVHPIIVRELLRWFGTDRRGIHTTYLIHDALQITDLRTDPDFNEQFIDNAIELREGYRQSAIDKRFLKAIWVERVTDRLADWIDRQPPDWLKKTPDARRKAIQATAVAFSKLGLDQLAREPSDDELNDNSQCDIVSDVITVYLVVTRGIKVERIDVDDAVDFDVCDGEFVYHIIIPLPGSQTTAEVIAAFPINDATLRVSMLEAANTKPTSISDEKSIADAIEIMLDRDLSQLPVMTTPSVVRGVVSWHSLCLWFLQGGNPQAKVKHCMEPPPRPLPSDTPLLTAIGEIGRHQYVLIRGKNNLISGIVTASDLSNELGRLSEPFIFLMEIENHIRGILGGRFTVQELVNACRDKDRKVEGLDDLTFGDYSYLLRQEPNWQKLGFRIPLRRFVPCLDKIGKIRNDVVHFRLKPKDLMQQDLDELRKFADYLRKLKVLQKIQGS